MGHLYHGYVSHNQRVMDVDCNDLDFTNKNQGKNRSHLRPVAQTTDPPSSPRSKSRSSMLRFVTWKTPGDRDFTNKYGGWMDGWMDG